MNATPPTAILIADLLYGDAGKGTIVDYLARELAATCVVRYNGGAQAAHNVVTADGRHHTFHQFGSATFVQGVRTHLSRFMLLHPLTMLEEARALSRLGVADAFARTTIDRRGLVITPYEQAANRLREMARGDARHGSCGLGVGETMSDWLAWGDEMIFAGDLADRQTVMPKLGRLRERKLAQLEGVIASLPETEAVRRELAIFQDTGVVSMTADLFGYFAGQVAIVGPEYLEKLLACPGTVLFEGAQGVLLDEWWGFYPYNTWTTLTYKNAGEILAEAGFSGPTWNLGLLRAYATRHGPGPLVTEDRDLTERLLDDHNLDNPWQRSFRVGSLDLVALRYALAVVGRTDALGVTCLDRLARMPAHKICMAYRYTGASPRVDEFFECRDDLVRAIRVPADPTDLAAQESLTRLLMDMQPVYTPAPADEGEYLAAIERGLGIPVAITSAGVTAAEKKARLPLIPVQPLASTETPLSSWVP